jgi:hypothetical protein
MSKANPESEYKKALRETVNELPGFYVWPQPAGMVKGRGGSMIHMAPKGAADLTGIHAPSGRRVELETKADGRADYDRADQEAQHKWRAMIRSAGGIYVNAKKKTGETGAESIARVVVEILEAVR